MMQGDRFCRLSVRQRSAMQQLNVKVFELSFEYLHIYFVVRKVAMYANIG